jgi:hypothetical protein
MIQLLRLREEVPLATVRKPYLPFSFLCFCILWPAFAITIEALTGLASEAGLNPLASLPHILACVGAPLGAILFAYNRQSNFGLYGLGFCLASSLAFTVLLGPLVIFGLILAIFVIGFLPLAPALSLLFSLIALRGLPSAPLQARRLAIGAATALALILAGESPNWVALALAEQAQSGKISSALRHWPGAASTLRDDCTQRNPQGLAFRWLRATSDDPAVDRDNACRAHYLLTGQSSPAPNTSITLATSHQRLGLNAQTGIEELNWILEFTAAKPFDEEASLLLQLPRHTVLYGASLWVDGVERPAVFGGASAVTHAFENVAVRQNRDPILLNYAGENRLHLRAYPISRQRPMKLRLRLARPYSDSKFLPTIENHNLTALTSPVLETLTQRTPPARIAFLDPYDSTRAFAWQPTPANHASALIYVIDHAASLDGQQTRLADMLRRHPGKLYFTQGTQIAEPFRGGADNVPALTRALQEAPEHAIIVWLHGPQPHLFERTYYLNRALQRNITLHPLRLAPGPNAVLNELPPRPNVIPIQDVAEAFTSQGQWTETTPTPGLIPSAAGAALWASTQDPQTAIRYRVITKDVGAVVLERDEHYTQNGLETPKEASGSEIPEPGTYVLTASALALLYWLRKMKTKEERLVHLREI